MISYHFFQVSVVLVLMSRRTDDDYHEVLLQIQALAPEMDIRKVVTDFERAIWNANHQVFIGAELAGCNFHHAQALAKNLDEHHLRNVYRSNGSVQVCLVMLPLSYVNTYFE